VGKSETVVRVSYLQNDKQQDGGSTNVCLRFLCLLIMNSLIWQVKFGTEVYFNILTRDMQNNSSLKLFKHDAM
jgi:hypothetical protein